MRELTCTTCGDTAYDVLYKARLPRPDDLDFAARRPGERHHPRIVRCRTCGQIYSSPYFDGEVLSALYRSARYIAEPQLENMTRDYLLEFEKALGRPRDKGHIRVLEIGCADGFFLTALRRAGYACVQGIEPGREAVSRAADDVRPCIRNDFFGPETFPADAFDVVCCFQVMDHLQNPTATMQAVHQVLKPGGLFIAINHDIRSPITKILGERSPMYDVEHIYLFDRSTMSRLLQNSGFHVVDCRRLSNSYTLDYALKMFPLPSALKRAVSATFSTLGLSSFSVRVPAGNMLTIGRRL